jgi:hypothetical protein
MTVTMRRSTSSLVILLGLAAGAFRAAPVLAQAQNPIQTQDTNIKDVVAELMECKREEGVLTVRLRFRNTNKTEHKVIKFITRDNSNKDTYDAYYVTAGSKKYFVLRDTEKKPLAPQTNGYGGVLEVTIEKDGSYVWWAKYPAPPADVKKVTYYTPMTPPFDNVPIS